MSIYTHGVVVESEVSQVLEDPENATGRVPPPAPPLPERLQVWIAYLDLQEILRNAIDFLETLCVRVAARTGEAGRQRAPLWLAFLLRRGGGLGWRFGAGIDALHDGRVVGGFRLERLAAGAVRSMCKYGRVEGK